MAEPAAAHDSISNDGSSHSPPFIHPDNSLLEHSPDVASLDGNLYIQHLVFSLNLLVFAFFTLGGDSMVV